MQHYSAFGSSQGIVLIRASQQINTIVVNALGIYEVGNESNSKLTLFIIFIMDLARLLIIARESLKTTFWIRYNEQTQKFGPFKSACRWAYHIIDNMPQDELISITVWVGNVGSNTSQQTSELYFICDASFHFSF